MIEGQLVSLRRVTEDDYELLASWWSDRICVYGSGTVRFTNREAVKRAIESDETRFLMVVDHKDARMGVVTWRRMAHGRSFNIGVGIADEELWAEGYGSEAVLLLLNHLFHTMGAHRVEFMAGLYNLQAVRVLTQGFMVLEGVLRDYFYLDGEFHDCIVLSLLRPDYYRMVEGLGISLDTIPAAAKNEAWETFRNYLSSISAKHFLNLMDERH